MRCLALVILATAWLVSVSPAGAAETFRAGAATADISPPPAGGGNDPAAFATCPAIFDGPRRFAFEEPYRDLNSNRVFDYGEPYCDANANGRYEEIYTSGATVGQPLAASRVHDPLEARAFAISDGTHTAVVVSVVAQGLFNTYIDRAIAQAKAARPSITAMVVSANHNESSPDTIGIYGGPSGSVPGAGSLPAGLRSGIDDYYMDFLVARVARAAKESADPQAMSPVSLWARQFPIPSELQINLSDNWPTTAQLGGKTTPTAIDPKVGLLQARRENGTPVFTVMSLAAHNQEVGHSGTADLSADWPGYFARALESRVGGQATFLVGDNGSEEDPQTIPPVTGAPGDPYPQAQATGEAWARAIAREAPRAEKLSYGALRYRRTDFCVPIENNLFKAAAGAGLFGDRQGYVAAGDTCVPSAPPRTSVGPAAPGAPDHLLTNVSLLDVGSDLQLISNPGEAFPALVLGSPWRRDDVPTECQGRANPPVPTWRSHALYRFQVGLAGDLIGYEIPAWAFIGSYGTFTTSDPACQTGSPDDPMGSTDSKGHHHKLETEGVGPTASNAVASSLAALVGADEPDPSARVSTGRYVKPDGSYSQFPAGAVGILLPRPGGPALDPSSGTLVGAPDVAGLGGRAVDANGFFMDYDGQPQAEADVTTRGMIVLDSRGCVTARHYLDEFPSLDTERRLGTVRSQPAVTPAGSCPAGGTPAPVPGLQPGPAQHAGIPVHKKPGACVDRSAPSTHLRRFRLTVHRGRLLVRGGSSDRTCHRRRGRVARVVVSIYRRAGKRCRFVGVRGRLGRPVSCRRPVLLLAHGRARWSLRLRLHLPHGRYVIAARATDTHGNVGRPHPRRSLARLRA